MVATTALMPINNLLPIPARIVSPWIKHRHTPNHPREEVVFKVYSPDELVGVYGPDGEEIIVQRPGKFINTYV